MTSTSKFLNVLSELGNKGYVVKKVYRRIQDRDLFLHAYSKLYPNRGAMTPGVDGETVDGMSLEKIDAIINDLHNGTYKWTPVKRVYIPKKDGKKRPLGIPTWKDKLVQEVIRLVLEAYYEPQFRDCSHGFRPNRGCHTALIHIKETWTGTTWFIEGDIKGCFDNIPHATILECIGSNFQDNRFLKLIKEMLQAGYYDGWKYHKTYSGTPQGGIASPLFANIVLHELDKWVEDKLLPNWNFGKKRKVTSEYSRYTDAIHRAKKKENIPLFKELQKARKSVSRVYSHEDDYRRLRYVRYADDFILGFCGTRHEAQEIKNLIAEKLATLGLEMSNEKTLITHAKNERARFLGYELRKRVDRKQSRKVKHKEGWRNTPTITGQIRLYVPRDVIKRAARTYTDPRGSVRLLHLDDFDIVATLGTELNGLINYYYLATNIHSLSEVVYAYKLCAVRTLANKHKCNTSVIWRKYKGTSPAPNEQSCIMVTIDNPRNPDKPYTAMCGNLHLRTQRRIGKYSDTKFIPHLTTTQLAERLRAQRCELCDSTQSIEVHHISKLNNLKKRKANKQPLQVWEERMIAINRKTLVVCRKCHLSIHTGKYDAKKLKGN